MWLLKTFLIECNKKKKTKKKHSTEAKRPQDV